MHMQFTVYIKLNYIQYRCLVKSVSIVCRLWAGQPRHHGSTSPTEKLRLGTFHIPASIMPSSTNDNRPSSYISTSSMFCNGVSTNSHNQWVIQGRYSVTKFSNKHLTRTHHLHQHVPHLFPTHMAGIRQTKCHLWRIINGNSTENHGNYHPVTEKYFC